MPLLSVRQMLGVSAGGGLRAWPMTR